jgi:hypothetical protein
MQPEQAVTNEMEHTLRLGTRRSWKYALHRTRVSFVRRRGVKKDVCIGCALSLSLSASGSPQSEALFWAGI